MSSPHPRRLAGAIAALAASGLLAPAATAQDAPAEPEVWYAQALTTSAIGPSITYFWSKGRSLRALTVVHGQPILTLVHREWYYVVNEIEGTGLAIQRSPRALRDDAAGGRPFAREAELILAQGAERVRSEQLGATKTYVYRLTDRVARREVWIPAEGEQLPLIVEVFDRKLKQTRSTKYLGWSRELELPDRFFEPDPRMQLERLNYEEYLKRSGKGPVGGLPILYGALLHGRRPEGG